MFGKKIAMGAFTLAATVTLAAAFPSPSSAALKGGAAAPDFSTQGALAGKPFTFRLNTALKKGPVVLYFFPKAFTQGCTLEANAFAEAMDDFEAAGAIVIGLSADDLPTLIDFSKRECRDEFGVARATPAVIEAFDVSFVSNGKATVLSSRTSYVIGQDGKIAMAYTDLNWKEHVSRTLAKVRQLASTN